MHRRCQVPVATASGQLIGWIDSKATFGDEAQHRCGSLDSLHQYF